MNLRSILTKEEMAEALDATTMTDVQDALSDLNPGEENQFLKAVKKRQLSSLGQQVLNVLEDYYRPAVKLKVDAKIASDSFTADEVEDLLKDSK